MLLSGSIAPAAQTASEVETLLRERMRFSAGDLRTLGRGSAIIRSLDTPVRQELAHIGAVYIDAPKELFLERFRDIERFESGPGIPQIGRFGATPVLGDLASLTLPPRDAAALEECQPGNCDIKLPASAMARYREQVPWSSPDATQHVNVMMREMLLDLVRAYQQGGNPALGAYDDGSESLTVADEFRALLDSSGDDPPVPVPTLLDYLDTYPSGRPEGVEDFFYWTVVDFGLQPTIRVNHVVIHPLEGQSGVGPVIAIKQLYASHYFHTTLELRFLIDAEGGPGQQGFYLVSFTRSRSDGMTGFRGALLRPIISRRSRNAVRGYLEHVKHQVERPLPAAGSAGTGPERSSFFLLPSNFQLLTPYSYPPKRDSIADG